MYDLSRNENPYPPLPSVLSAVNGAAQRLNRYPDMLCTELTTAIAEHLDVPVPPMSSPALGRWH
ncbi:putative aminotransferase (plasmid) [Streptomyces sp. YIM 121038]|nr:putative aminotransferase [Streptomyces sp. YIM 121038]